MKIIEKIKKEYKQEVKEGLNYPISSRQLIGDLWVITMAFFGAGAVLGSTTLGIIGKLLIIVFLWIVGISLCYWYIYTPMKRYESCYGSTKLGDE